MNLGAFELGEKLGQGGMSEVFAGHHMFSGTPVALKITKFAPNDDFLRRAFTAEIVAMARVQHPGIVRIHDWGILDDGSGNWCAMDKASAGCLQTNQIHSWNDLKQVLEQVLQALAHAHARNIVHRDLKPANVLVFGDSAGWRFRLADFGLAYSRYPENDTRAFGGFAGTPLYMPPEQLHGRWREYGPWTDLYALGCMAFELSTGRPPFIAKTAVEIALAHCNAERPRLNPRFSVPSEFETWVHWLLERDWLNRPHAAALALQRFRELPDVAHQNFLVEPEHFDAETLKLDSTQLLATLTECPPPSTNSTWLSRPSSTHFARPLKPHW